MSLRVLSMAVPAAAFQSAAGRNASIVDTLAYLARLRALQRTTAVFSSLGFRVGTRLREVGIPEKTINKRSSAVIVEDRDGLRTVIVDEALWYFRAGALQLRHASDSAIRGHPTLGHTSAYYASFYLIQALCRLAGRIPLYLRDYQTSRRPGPTILLAWDGSVPARRYSISSYLVRDVRGGLFGSHRAVWEVFFSIFGNCPDTRPHYLDAVKPQSDSEEETRYRNDHTYVPWMGFREIASLAMLDDARREQSDMEAQARQAIEIDGLVALSRLATDPAFGPYARACLRASLAIRFLDALAQKSRSIGAAWSSVRDDLRAQLVHLGDLDAATAFLEGAIGRN